MRFLALCDQYGSQHLAVKVPDRPWPGVPRWTGAPPTHDRAAERFQPPGASVQGAGRRARLNGAESFTKSAWDAIRSDEMAEIDLPRP